MSNDYDSSFDALQRLDPDPAQAARRSLKLHRSSLALGYVRGCVEHRHSASSFRLPANGEGHAGCTQTNADRRS